MTEKFKETVSLKADLAVLGGGGAGLSAALTAAQKGLNVIVLEKRGALGGNSIFPKGLFAAESPVQKKAMIDARADEIFKTAMDWAHWKIDPLIVRVFINKSGNTIQWLEDMGLNFELVQLFPNQVPLVWHVLDNGGAAIIKVLKHNCSKLGVRLLTRVEAKKIVRNSKNNSYTILTENQNKELIISAGSVLICTGGYGGNKKMLVKYCPDYREGMDRTGLPHNGDGIRMALEIGAATEGLGIMQLGGPSVPRSVTLSIQLGTEMIKVPLFAIASEPNTMWINKLGKRFIDEAAGYVHFVSANAVIRQPDNVCYTLLDSAIVKDMTQNGLFIGRGPYKEMQRVRLPGLVKELHKLAGKDWVITANNWDHVANWIGADTNILKNTIKQYNNACQQGHDGIFAKDRKYLASLEKPPYYAIRSHADFTNTIGGIKINEKMEVLDKYNEPIPGLYAAGVDTGGWESDTYCAVLAGSTFGFAINSGRIAAENAVQFVHTINAR